MAEIGLQFRRVLKLIIIVAGVSLAHRSEAVVRIMPLGDSLTAAMNGQASYRYWLWKKLVSAGAKVDFVGSQIGVSEGVPRYSDFDQNHEGHSGWTAFQVSQFISGWARTYRPNIVLIDLGVNDLIQGKPAPWVINQLKIIILKLRVVNPQVRILVAKTPPMLGYEDQIADFNYQIGLMAAQMNRPNSQVYAVDLAYGYDVATDTSDGVHPNESGEKKIANRFYGRIVQLLILLRQPAAYPWKAIQF